MQQHKTLREILDGTCSLVTGRVRARGGTSFREPAWRGTGEILVLIELPTSPCVYEMLLAVIPT